MLVFILLLTEKSSIICKSHCMQTEPAYQKGEEIQKKVYIRILKKQSYLYSDVNQD
jgi:hypothetical protein